MQNDEPNQRCPFCGQSWGTCDHYRILSEWEEIADAAERADRQRKRLVAEPAKSPLLENRRGT